MKRILFLSVIAIAFTLQSNAQEISKNALGLRIGDNDGLGAEISYQTHLGSSNRLEFDLGWRDGSDFDAFKLAGLYQWVMPLEDNFNWYFGAGGGLGNVDFENDALDDGFFLFIAGDIGIEYNFDIPLLLSLDFRPEVGLSGYDDFDDDTDFDIALGIRYQF